MRGSAITAAALAAALGALLTSAALQFDTRQTPSPAAGAPPLPPAEPEPPRVAYAGLRDLAGPVVLRARVVSARARIVAVTWRLDGRPLGTDTTAPYTLATDASLLPPGRHHLRVEAVDRLGARAESAPVRVRARGAFGGLSVPGPGPAFERAVAALARGHVAVRLGPGEYPVRGLSLGNGARLVGAGPSTVLAAAAGGGPALVTVRARDVELAGLALDGGGRVDSGVAVFGGAARVRLTRLRIAGVRENGVHAWGGHAEVSVQDSSIAGAGAYGAGVYDQGSDDSRDTSVVRTAIRGFRGYGIDFAQRYYGRPSAALHSLALDNRIADIVDPAVANGTREGGIWSGGVAAAIVGNAIRDTGWDGIETVGSSRGTSIVANDIARTRVGIYLEHETIRSLIARNTIAGVITGINSEWRYGGRGNSDNTLTGNRISDASETGLFIDVAGDGNRIAGNLVIGGAGPAIVLQGASRNLVSGNRACARPGPVVRLQSAGYDNGVAAHSLGNRVTGNVRSCAP
jgi:parallel beta-helix repeat protein